MDSKDNGTSSLLINEQEQSRVVPADLPVKSPPKTNVGELRIHFNPSDTSSSSLTDGKSKPSCGTGVGRSPCDSANIMKSFIVADERNNRHWIYGALITAIISLLVSIACFHWYGQPPVKDAGGLVLFMCGSFLLIVVFIALLTSCIRCSASASTRNSNDCMTSDYACFWVSSYTGTYTQMLDNILLTIHLEDEVWRNQIDSIRDTVSTRIAGCLTRKNYNGLKRRSCGHILIAQQGIIIDELIVIAYARNILLGIELVGSIVQTEFIFRLHFITRYYFRGAYCMDEPKKFQIDLFLPPNLQPQEIINIGQAIEFYSRIHE